ncbi:serine protease [Roseovarius sp. C7]|uniref:serine protease n=1 Tax=Roseovarius sp. C7 TaxID=3398643 RepID=UPI0039F6A76A
MDETPAEARRSERALTREDRAALQVALQWAGHYDGRIDAAFGAGTRRSMAAWQEANNYEATGILTTAQRADLLDQYNAVLKGMGLELVEDTTTGIRMKLPLGVVEFARLEPPFAHYEASGDIPAKVLLISQPGNQDTLFGLYDIMQTLEIVPLDGPRERKSDSFELIGEGATQISHTVASLRDGQIKGFTLVWPAGDEERRARVLAEMQASFERIEGVLDPAAGNADSQSVDLVSGLEIRKPLRSRSGFYVDGAGSVITSTEAVEGCGYITIEDDHRATIATRDDAAGIAVLRPEQTLAPQSVAAFQTVTPRLKSEVAVLGYSFGGVLGAPTLTYGKLEDIRGLNGEAGMKRLALNALEGDVGGPVVDTGGAVLGMLLPSKSNGRVLPDGVSLAANADALTQILQDAGITPMAAGALDPLSTNALSDAAGRMTVLVSCWE